MPLYWLTAFLFKIFARVFLRLKVEGIENLPAKGGFILAANHASSLDPFVVIAAVPRYIRWLVVYEYYDLWYLRWILRRMGFIRVEKNLPKEAFRALLRGEIIGLFPEARRTWTGHLGPARPGTALLARRTFSPVVPLAILGTFTALPRTTKRLRLHPVTVRIGAPVFFSAQDKGDLEQLDRQNMQKVMANLSALLSSPPS